MIKLSTKKWSLVFYANSIPVRKYVIHLHGISDDSGEYPDLPISVVEKGKPGEEIYIATYPNMIKRQFISLHDLAFEHNSAIEWFESVEDFN